VVDNLAAHKQPEVCAHEAADAQIRFLPPYSPDFNPIEQALAKLKAFPPEPHGHARLTTWSRLSPPRSKSTHWTRAGIMSDTAAIGSLYSYETRSNIIVNGL
jgi:transposase